jgi:Glycosyl transferase family 2
MTPSILQQLAESTLPALTTGASEQPRQKHPKPKPLPRPQLHSPLMEQVGMTTPQEAKVLVISKGDSALLNLEGRRAGHFPQTDSGDYLGHHPADSAEAIARLETLRCRGAEYLIIPESSLWWLKHYRAFHEFLQGECSLVAQQAGVGQIHHLQKIRRVRPKRPLRVVAVLCVRNEERFIAHSLRHLTAQGLEIHLIDNGSTDCTVELAKQFLGHGLRRIEHLPHDGIFRLPAILRRKEELSATLDADWIMHADADEIAMPPPGSLTLAEAINFVEHTFVPTLEAPDHDHADYQKTMRWYYPFAPRIPWQMRAWKKSSMPVSLAASGGHLPHFTGARLYPEFFRLKHYQFLSIAHAARKYGSRNHDPEALRAGLHGGPQGWRNRFSGAAFNLPPQAELREFFGDDRLDATCPWTTHWIEKAMPDLKPK